MVDVKRKRNVKSIAVSKNNLEIVKERHMKLYGDGEILGVAYKT